MFLKVTFNLAVCGFLKRSETENKVLTIKNVEKVEFKILKKQT